MHYLSSPLIQVSAHIIAILSTFHSQYGINITAAMQCVSSIILTFMRHIKNDQIGDCHLERFDQISQW